MFLEEQEYQHVLALLDKKIEKTPILEGLTLWVKQEFDVDIYDYVCDKTKNGLTRLRIVVWDYAVTERFCNGANYDTKKQRKFQVKFSELARKYDIHPEYHNANTVFVCFETIRDQIAGKLLWSLKDNIYALQKDDIWKISIIFESVHIFYETDAQITAHEEDGTSGSLTEMITEIVKVHDRYQVFKDGVPCVFTSHQTLDEKYKGSMFFYTR